MSDMYDAIKSIGLVPVIKLDRIEDAEPLGEALMAGGFGVAEITFRTSAAAESIRRLRTRFPNMLVGAGTILTLDQAKASIDEANLASYLALGNVLACGGSWMVKDELISQGKFDEITRLSRQAVGLVKKIRNK